MNEQTPSESNVYSHPEYPEIMIIEFGEVPDWEGHRDLVRFRWNATAQPALLIFDFSKTNTLKIERRWFLGDFWPWKSMKLFLTNGEAAFVCPGDDSRSSSGLVTKTEISEYFARVFESVEDAVVALLPLRNRIVNNSAPMTKQDGELLKIAQLVLVGSEETDLVEVADTMIRSGANLRRPNDVSDGDFVIFCVSAANGPLPGTREAVNKCAGKQIFPLAIVFTNSALVDDGSLRELLYMEERELLTRILSDEIIDALPCFQDFDPCFDAKIAQCIRNSELPIQCKSM